jgi:hypothetical protein
MSALEEQIGGNHYKDMAIQPIVFCTKNRLGYAESMAIKYLCRHRKKNGKQDLEKAIHCIKLLIEMEYPETDVGDGPEFNCTPIPDEAKESIIPLPENPYSNFIDMVRKINKMSTI